MIILFLEREIYNNTHRVTIVYSQKRKTDKISKRDNIKTWDPGSNSAKC